MKANQQFYNGQDQVKAFHSKMMMADVLQEREAQQRVHNRKKEIEKAIDKQWLELEQQQLKEYDEKEVKKFQDDQDKKKKNSKVISDQLQDFKLRYIKQLEEQMLEGELIKRQSEA